jgi:hypothetical protein
LREVLLLDSQSTIDLMCNRNLVKRTFRSNKRMSLKSNGGTMVLTKKAEISGYHAHVWYHKNAIANILSLRNMIKQYPVTYDSDYKMFVVHRESVGKPNMEFRMHKSGIHYYDPRNDDSTFDDDDDDEHLDDTAITGVTDDAITGVAYAATIPGVAGVNDAVATDDLDEPTTATTPYAEPVETAPDAQPAEPKGADATEASSDPPTTVSTRLYTMTATKPQTIGLRSNQRKLSEASAFCAGIPKEVCPLPLIFPL